MKKQILIASLFAGLVATTSFGQGYITEGASKNSVYYGPNNGSASGLGSGTGFSVFLWAPTSTADQLGAAVSTTAATVPGTSWSTIATMLTSGWAVATNSGTGAEADGTVTPSGIAIGGISYNGGSAFQLAGSTGGSTYELIAIAWQGTQTTLAAAMAAGDALGWSSSFNYVTGAGSSDPNGTKNFSAEASGFGAFGVAPIASVPEPTTIALAGLGGLALLGLRRKK